MGDYLKPEYQTRLDEIIGMPPQTPVQWLDQQFEDEVTWRRYNPSSRQLIVLIDSHFDSCHCQDSGEFCTNAASYTSYSHSPPDWPYFGVTDDTPIPKYVA